VGVGVGVIGGRGGGGGRDGLVVGRRGLEDEGSGERWFWVGGWCCIELLNRRSMGSDLRLLGWCMYVMYVTCEGLTQVAISGLLLDFRISIVMLITVTVHAGRAC
jgi:hypothetical protein